MHIDFTPLPKSTLDPRCKPEGANREGHDFESYRKRRPLDAGFSRGGIPVKGQMSLKPHFV